MRIDMAEEYTLKVGEARPSDVGRGIARVDQAVLYNAGWQAGDVARGQYALFGMRILNLSISASATDRVVTGESRFYSDGNQDWTETSLEGWVAAADLSANEEALWKIANSDQKFAMRDLNFQ